MAEWLMRLALKLVTPLRWGSNPMRGSCQLLTEGCWSTPRNSLFLQLWKLTAIYNQTWLKNGVKHLFTSPHLKWKVHRDVYHNHKCTFRIFISLSAMKCSFYKHVYQIYHSSALMHTYVGTLQTRGECLY